MGIIWWLIVGLIAGWLTGKLMGGPGMIYTVFVAVLGAVLLTWIVRKMTAAKA